MSSVLIANRGEIAVRIIRAARRLGMRTVAVHPADDAEGMHVRLADDAALLPGAGPAAYSDSSAIVQAARDHDCDLVHPGYGFLSESADLAQACAEASVTFVGPSPEVLRLFGDKSRAREQAGRVGLPMLAGTKSAASAADVTQFVAQHGASMIKAVAGGGGRGMAEVHAVGDVADAYEQCRREAQLAFGSSELYVEQLAEHARHIEMQIIGDGSGMVTQLGERDCTIQRRHQKLVEVAPSPTLEPSLRSQIAEAAVVLGESVAYSGVGTVEFLVTGDRFWFMEVNPRLQVEHTITEQVTGVDLVASQLRIASGASLTDLGLDEDVEVSGFAIESRVNLESLHEDGTVSPGVGHLAAFTPPSGPGVRVDSCGYPGLSISPRYDSLIAKVVASGDTFAEARQRMGDALDEFTLDGVTSNLDFQHGIVTSGDFGSGAWTTSFVTDHFAALSAHRRDRGPSRSAATDHEDTVTPVDGDTVVVRAPMAGVVSRLDVARGDTVGEHTAMLVLEAMKMEHVVTAPRAMTIAHLAVSEGDVVDVGDALAGGEPATTETSRPSGGDERDWSAEVEEVRQRRAWAGEHGGPAKVERQHALGKLTARERIEALADEGSFAEIGVLTGFPVLDDEGRTSRVQPANFVGGTIRIDGRKAVIGADDFTLRAGSGDAAIHAKQVFIEEYANQMRLPVVRLLDGASGGGSVKMAMDAGYTYVPVNPGWDAVVDSLSVVPVVSAALGPTVGLGAARLVTSHLAVLVEGLGQAFTAGPPVVGRATGEDLTKDELGGAEVHRTNGTVERIVSSEAEAFDLVRRFLSYLPSSVDHVPPVVANDDPVDRRDDALLTAVPHNPRRTYDIGPILDAVFDAGSVFRYAEYGGGTLTALARLDGHPVGVLATDPRQGATMSVEGAQAITRLVDLCETFHLPIVSLTDQAGMSIGSAAEQRATIRHGARAIAAVYQARVPQAEIIVRRVYGVGGAGVVNRHRAGRSWAWPSGDWGSLPGQGGIDAAFSRQIAAADDPAAEAERISRALGDVASPFRTAEQFGVQDLIDPRESRALLCDWVRDAYDLVPTLTGRPTFGTRP